MRYMDGIRCCLILCVLFYSNLVYTNIVVAQKNDECKTPSIFYATDYRRKEISKENEAYNKIFDESKRLFRSSTQIREAIKIEQLQRWYETGVIEVNFTPPCAIETLHPEEHSYSVMQLVIPIEGWRKPGKLPITTILVRQKDVFYMFINHTQDLNNLKDAVKEMLEHNSAGSGIRSTDIESHVSELIKQKNYSEAIKVYQSAIDSTKDKAAMSKYYYNLGMVYKLLNDKKGQIDAMRNAANTTPDLSVRCDYLDVLGKLLIDSKQIEEAKKVFQEVSAKSKKDWQKKTAQFNLLRIEQAEGKLDTKIKSLEKQLKDNPQDSNTLQDLAVIYDEILKDYAKAIPVYEKLSNLQPDALPILSRLQFCYEEQGQIDKSLAIYEKLMEKDPKSSQKVLERALKLAIRAKQPQTAVRWGKKYVEAEPNDPNAQAVLGRIAFQVEDYNLAAETLSKAESLATSSEQRDKLIIEQIAVAEKQNNKEAIEKNLRRLIKITESNETRATGFIMLVRFLQKENRLQELITW